MCPSLGEELDSTNVDLWRKGKSRIFDIVCFLQIVFFLFRLSGRDSNNFFKIHGFSIDKFVGWIEVELKAPARPRLHVLHPVFTSLKTGGRSTYVKGPTNLANVMTSNDLHLPQPISALAGTTLRPARDALFVPAGWEALRREPGEGRLSVHLITSSCLCLCVWGYIPITCFWIFGHMCHMNGNVIFRGQNLQLQRLTATTATANIHPYSATAIFILLQLHLVTRGWDTRERIDKTASVTW